MQQRLSIADREMKVHLAAADVDQFEFFDKEEFLKGAQGAVFVYDAGDYGSFEAVVKVRSLRCRSPWVASDEHAVREDPWLCTAGGNDLEHKGARGSVCGSLGGG